MVQVNEITAKTADKCYQRFRELLYNSPLNIPQAYLFVGSPEGKKISWCPPCREAHPDFIKIAKDYADKGQFYTVTVGSKKEWIPEKWGEKNPFKVNNLPMIEGVPTMEIYIRLQDDAKTKLRKLVRVLDPRLSDMLYIIENYLPRYLASIHDKEKEEITKCTVKGHCS
jgi:thiol-disulfide isomerase/thioredoxin